MGPTRFTFDSVRSCVWVSGRSSLHPINTETRGLKGWFEAGIGTDGSLDLDQPVSGELELAVERLTSGNQLYDRELRRRMDARRYPTIAGRITDIVVDGSTRLPGHRRDLLSRQDADVLARNADRGTRRQHCDDG